MISLSINRIIPRLRIASSIIVTLSILFVPLSVSVAQPTQSHLHRLYNGTALNWSGYAAASSLQNPSFGSATDVKGSWTVPNLTCTQNGYASTWVGLDGYNSSSVEQIGIESDCNGGRASYYAWFEMYPFPARFITSSIHAGDHISAEVSSSSNHFFLSLTNATTHRSYATFQTLRGAAHSSAEWIVEAPSNFNGQVLPLANFGQVNFTAASATINNHSGPISSFANDPLTMVNLNNQPISVPSLLSNNGTAFSVAYQ